MKPSPEPVSTYDWSPYGDEAAGESPRPVASWLLLPLYRLPAESPAPAPGLRVRRLRLVPPPE